MASLFAWYMTVNLYPILILLPQFAWMYADTIVAEINIQILVARKELFFNVDFLISLLLTCVFSCCPSSLMYRQFL
jgi:hypothetical protein